MVDKHAPREVDLVLALHFNMDQQPSFGTVAPPDLNELVRPLNAKFGIRNRLAQLGIQRSPTATPVDIAMNLGEEESDERLEPQVHRFLPGFVVHGHDKS
jgi:hypothetical protein